MAHGSYIICATPRSGSTLLCDLLTATGRAGVPASFYRSQSVPDYAQEFGIDAVGPASSIAFDRAYLNAVISAGTAQTGVFGMRLMADNAEELFARLARLWPEDTDDAARMAKAFGAPIYIHLSRLDTVGQAVSLLKANQSGLWHRAADGTERERTSEPRPAVYDAGRISEHRAYLEAGNRTWMR